MIQAAFVSSEDEYKRLVAIVYAQHYSEEDLQALTAFYKSPDVGQKMLKESPEVTKETMAIGNGCGRSASWQMLRRASDTA